MAGYGNDEWAPKALLFLLSSRRESAFPSAALQTIPTDVDRIRQAFVHGGK